MQKPAVQSPPDQRINALYGRQSVDRKDSISVENQIEMCLFENRNDQYEKFIDKGWSGKNIKRPEFQRMLQEIKAGNIKKVIVYRLDRISRSMLDFVNMMELFTEYDVEFVSVNEKIDTSTSMNRAMLNMGMIFAQLERETIQERVTDIYHSLSKQGHYMGGRVPLGFRLEPIIYNGRKTSKLDAIEEHAEIVKILYKYYSNPQVTLGELVRYLNNNSILKPTGADWCTANISRVLSNPVYVKADADVYDFFSEQGADIINCREDFNGELGCYLFQGQKSKTRKTDLTDKRVVIAPHKGLIDSSTWLIVRRKLLRNKTATVSRKPSNSWLTGKMKCGNCGYGLVVRRGKASKTHDGIRYLNCSKREQKKTCDGPCMTMTADTIEAIVFESISNELNKFNCLNGNKSNIVDSTILINQRRITEIELEIDGFLAKVPTANDSLMRIINEKVDALDIERQELKKKISEHYLKDAARNINAITNHVSNWGKTSFDDKRLVTDILIERISIANGTIDIEWKI